MAYTADNLKLHRGGVINEWVYESTDGLATVLGASYVTGAVTAGTGGAPGKGLQEGDKVLFRRYGTLGTASSFAGAWDLVVGSVNTTTGAATLISMNDGFEAYLLDVSTAAGANNVSTVTVTAKDADGNTLLGAYVFDLYFAEDADGTTITSAAYSGTLVASTGAIVTTLTAKKHFKLVTDPTTGTFVGSLTDTAETALQYAVAVNPSGTIDVALVVFG